MRLASKIIQFAQRLCRFARLRSLLVAVTLTSACDQVADVTRTPDVGAEIVRSAESQRLQNYYAGIQNRLRAQGLLRTDGGGPDVPFDAASLARDFERIALYDEYTIRGGRFVAQQTPSHLRRWQRPIRIGIIFGPLVSADQRAKDTVNVTNYARRLAGLTGLSIQVTNTNPNFHVLFVNRDAQKTIGSTLQGRIPDLSPIVINEIQNTPRNTFCVAYAFSDASDNNAYAAAIILIKAEHADLMRLSCIHEEMAQALGLANDSPEARPSIFNDDEEFALLTTHDEMLLKMLYDPRLQLGMTPESARPILPIVASDAVGGS